MEGRRRGIRFLAAALTALLLAALLPVSGLAANRNGLVVEKLSFRDVLRIYTADKAHFGENALALDENGVSNAAKNLAEMFAYTVGLNYHGEGFNYNYFGKDISGKMGAEPYTEANLLASYRVEILPVRSAAQALPEGSTTNIRVYLCGYKNAANGVDPVLHYVWQDGGRWYAVKDDNPYYRVSYNGQSAQGSPYTLAQCHAQGGSLGQWRDLAALTDGTAVQLSGSTLVVGSGSQSVFAVTENFAALQQSGAIGPVLAMSDYVQGDTTYQNGPLVYTRECVEEGTNHKLSDGEMLRRGVTYRFRLVYDEALVAQGGEPGLIVRSQVNGRENAPDSFVWYGAAEFLSGDKYNPHTVEFTYTPNGEGQGLCVFTMRNLLGHDSRLPAASFHERVDGGDAPAPTAVPAPTATAVTESQPAATAEVPAAPAAEATPAPTAEPTPAPTAEPTPAPTPVPAATPSAMTQATTLPLLTAGGGSALVTRGMLAESLWILSGRQVTGLSGSFTDMPGSFEGNQAVIWAAATGLMPGRSDGSFGGNESVTREECAGIFYRYAQLKGLNGTGNTDLSPWTDGALVSSNAQAAVRWALETGIMAPREGGLIAPTAPALCGEVTGMIYRLQGM